ncbi:glycogen debranching N-terminal domain-containing protein [Plantactinospora siamensis]|uniref:Glycogen debranching N-terminal domain-containing protein n=1 Tax=Plantactinospora siamensis TaxID=555372 RepID=A0ABV6NSQ9_9ACTN
MTPRLLQPLLHDLVSVAHAPTSALSDTAGQIRAGRGVQGVFHADARVLSRAELLVDGREPEVLCATPDGPHGARYVSLARWLGDPGADPTVRIDRVRRIGAGELTEEIHIVSTAASPVRAEVSLAVAADLAPIEVVKSGGSPVQLTPAAGADRFTWAADGTTVTVTGADARAEAAAEAGPNGTAARSQAGPDGTTVRSQAGPNGTTVRAEAGPDGTPVRAEAGPDGTTVRAEAGSDGAGVSAEGADRLCWSVDLPPGGTAVLRWRLHVDDPRAVVQAPDGEPTWSRPAVTAGDHRLVRLLDRSLDDLRALRLAEPAAPADVFLAAGVPWFLTLFGRDSMWAARMMLPLGTELAAGTLRVLARRQGTRLDPQSGEAPGKIMHELRRHEFTVVGNGLQLPAAYYGTVDATLLWVVLLHEAWRWGMPADEVAALLPNLEAALGWLADYADADGDGFVEYVDTSGRGLANQGWKDSGDAVRFADGSLGRPPIALTEVQGYAHQAALAGAALLDAFDRPGGQRWRDYAGELNRRFRERFWVDGPLGAHPALALDGDKRAVDSLTSNIGHLLGTGLLSAAEEAQVAAVLASPEMSGGFGLRTMSTKDAGFSPLSYHCGSIWAHDTAIVLAGLAAGGFAEPAGRLADGLLGAAEAFDYRLPELYGGDDRAPLGRPVPYPAACSPQAWSAAAAVAVLWAALGLDPDVPGGVVRLRPMAGLPLGPVTAQGLRIGGAEVTVSVDAGGVSVTGLPAGLRVSTSPVTPAEPLAPPAAPTVPAQRSGEPETPVRH